MECKIKLTQLTIFKGTTVVVLVMNDLISTPDIKASYG